MRSAKKQMRASRVAQWIFDRTLEDPVSGWTMPSRLLHVLFRIILKFGDPLIARPIWGTRLYLPFSHQLPFVLKHFVNYGTNLARIVQYTQKKYPDLRIIDVGANIGDSVAVIRQHSEAPVLCLEGDPVYFEILCENQSSLRNGKTIPCFVGETAGHDFVNLERHRGST